MELLTAGVDLVYIRDLLGHSSVITTEVYARTDAQLKRKAIEAASKEIVPEEESSWDLNKDLRDWLKGFNKASILCKEIPAQFIIFTGLSRHFFT